MAAKTVAVELVDGTALDDEHEPDPEKGELFNKEQYTSEALALPLVDGQSIDRIKLGFGGEVMLDRSSETHVALFRKMQLGKPFELRVTGRVAGTGAAGATNKDGNLDVVVGTKKISITDVRILEPEELT